MNDDVMNHIIKLVKNEIEMCHGGMLIHDGGKESAIETYQAVVQMLTEMRARTL